MLHNNLDGRMTLFKMVEHYETCLVTRRFNEDVDDKEALRSIAFTHENATPLEKHAAEVFTPKVFKLVLFSIKAVRECVVREILDASDVTTFVVSKKERMDKKFEVRVEEQ